MATKTPVLDESTIVISNITDKCVTVSWEKALDGVPNPQDYLFAVQCGLICSPMLKTTTTKYTFIGLEPDKEYRIAVVCFAAKDESWVCQNDPRPIVKTLPSNLVPQLNDSTVEAMHIGSDCFTVSWEKALDGVPNPGEYKFDVQYYDDVPGVTPYVYSNMKKKTNVLISGLEPSTTYKFRVICRTVKGEKICQSDTKSVTTKAIEASTEPNGPTTPQTSQTDAQRRKKINEGLAGINYSPACLINNTMYFDSEEYPEAIENKLEKAAYLLSVTPSQTDTKEIYVRGSGYKNIYPGAILVVDSAITSGSPHPIGAIARNNVSLYGDFLAQDATMQPNTVPTNEKTRAAINNIMKLLLKNRSYQAPGSLKASTTIYSSQKDMMLDFKVDSSFAGIDLNVSCKTDSNEQSFIQATTLEQDYFTINLADDWIHDPSSLFGPEVTWEDLRKILNNQAIAIVTSVTYGRTFSYLKEFSSKKFTYTGSQTVKGYGQSADLSQDVSESQEYTNDDIFNLGGTALPIQVLRGKKSLEELNKAMADNMKFSESNQGVVTKYTIQLITGPNPGVVLHPEFKCKTNKISYIRCPQEIEAYVNVRDVTILGGMVGVRVDQEIFKVVNGKKVMVDTNEGDWGCDTRNSGNFTFGGQPEGCYIAPNPKIRIRKKRGPGYSFSPCDEKRADVSSGKIKIVLSGNVHTGNVNIVSIEDNSD